MSDELIPTEVPDRANRESRSRRSRTAALLATLPLGATGIAALGSGSAAAAATHATSSGGGTVGQFPAPPGPGASLADWQSWAASQRSAMEAVPWAADMTADGCTVASVTFPSTPADIGLTGAPAGVDSTGLGVVAKCPAGVSPLSALAGQRRSPRAHSVPTGNTCGSVTDGTQCVSDYNNGGTYVETSYENTSSSTVDGYEEMSQDGATAQSCSSGSEVGQYPSSGYIGLGSGSTAYYTYGPINADNVWDGTWWKGTGSYSDTGDVCSYI